MPASLKNQRYSHPVFLTFEFGIFSFEQAAKLLDIPFRNKLDPAAIFQDVQFLAGPKAQCIPERFRYDDLIFRRYGYRAHTNTPVDTVSYYDNAIDREYQARVAGRSGRSAGGHADQSLTQVETLRTKQDLTPTSHTTGRRGKESGWRGGHARTKKPRRLAGFFCANM